MTFPENFVWGAAAASYQIEGAAYEDGRGLSVWDMLCRQPGRIWEGQSGDVACDHYHRYKEDVALMREMGLQAYRLSVAWPRVLPEGTGAVNAKGLDFYDRLVDELLAANIQPWVTLFHWDFPYALYCRGGWLNPNSSDWFAEYTSLIVDKLSDRVSHWITVNEPQCVAELGHHDGIHAPGDKLGFSEILKISHNILLAHGKAVQTIRAYAKTPAKIGFAPAVGGIIPATQSEADVTAARVASFSNRDLKLWNVSWWSDPMIFGKYPEDGLKLFGKSMPSFTQAEMDTIHQPLDFYGINLYTGIMVKADPAKEGQAEIVKLADGFPQTAFPWKVLPDALYWATKFLYERYKLPIVVTENGMSNIDWVSADGQVHDPQRIDFTHSYLNAYQRAISEGAEAWGYFHWSVMDNFEWAEGYKHRFGLVYVDYTTQKRTLKDSAHWYKRVISQNGL
jgi:beta-glucosidase